jgi:pectate lyase
MYANKSITPTSNLSSLPALPTNVGYFLAPCGRTGDSLEVIDRYSYKKPVSLISYTVWLSLTLVNYIYSYINNYSPSSVLCRNVRLINNIWSRVFLLGILSIALSSENLAQLIAFSGADGFGKYASGGRGGRVIEVTNLDDSGPGSLRAAIEQEGPRTIVFRISGTISLESDLTIEHGDLTIAGQTAPGDGICIRNYKTQIAADNVIVRFIRFRLGDATRHAEDALGANGTRNVIIDHCSMSWGIDEVASFYDNEDFTLQWSIISESLNNSYHPKGNHGYGGIWGGAGASFHHNLLAHHTSRNPRFHGGRTPATGDYELVDFRNNVVYNWGFQCAYGGEVGRQNVVANYFKPGPATTRPDRFLELYDREGRWYVADNVLEGNPVITDDNWLGVDGPAPELSREESSYSFIIETTRSAWDAYEDVLRFTGAILPQRDAVDERIIHEVRNGIATYGSDTYSHDQRSISGSVPHGIIDSQSEVGGWPELQSIPPPIDTDGDGIPDEWEIANGLDPDDPNDSGIVTDSGYSNLELYLNELAARRWDVPQE